MFFYGMNAADAKEVVNVIYDAICENYNAKKINDAELEHDLANVESYYIAIDHEYWGEVAANNLNKYYEKHVGEITLEGKWY